MSRSVNRRPVARAASPEAVFAQRRVETPYQIYFEISNIGRNVESSKKRARWKFCFGEEGREHEVTLVHSVMSGKKKTFFNGEMINEAQKVSKEWSFAWSFGAHLLRVGINFEEYALVIDGIPFKSFSRRDPYLAAQLEATKRDSMRSLQSDEQRRFDRLGYAGDEGGGSRSRTAERRRPSAGSAGSAGSRRASSNGRSRDEDHAPRRSASMERRGSESRASPPARSSSSRRLQSPPSASGPGDQQQRGTRSGKQRGSQSSAAANGGGARRKDSAPAAAPASASATEDILSADPSTLEVNPFDAHVPDGSFDPLGVKQTAAVAAGGDAFANGGGDGGWAGAGGAYGGGFGGGGQDDAAAVLQLGMQFEAMGGNPPFQPQQQQQPSQQQEQYFQPQQQQHNQSPFDQGAYQQYDESGFPQPVQQAYNPPQQAMPADSFGVAPLGFGAAGGYGGYQQQQKQQQQQQPGHNQEVPGSEATQEQKSEDSKASFDPWDVARGGMVNIDDITDTKHLPPVEVKPFTNDHRPLADLVREAPPRVQKAVMMERPEPPPTHMAVAIVPFQAPGQQQPAYGHRGYPQQQQQQQPQQSGNPFSQLQLTQFGQQAQPILLTRSSDPFHEL